MSQSFARSLVCALCAARSVDNIQFIICGICLKVRALALAQFRLRECTTTITAADFQTVYIMYGAAWRAARPPDDNDGGQVPLHVQYIVYPNIARIRPSEDEDDVQLKCARRTDHTNQPGGNCT